MKPILGPDGKPLMVSERQPITAASVNAQIQWTEDTIPQILEEHSPEGLHNRGYHCQGILWFSLGLDLPIKPESFYRGKTMLDDSSTYIIMSNYPGYAEIYLSEPLPDNPAFILHTQSLMQSDSMTVGVLGSGNLEIYAYRDSPSGSRTMTHTLMLQIWGA